MATITVRGRGPTGAAPDEVTIGLTVEALRTSAAGAFAEGVGMPVEGGERELVAEVDVTFQLEQG